MSGGFVKLPYHLIDSGRLTQNELTVYISLLRHRDHRTGQCWPSYGTIAREARVSRSTAIRVIKALETHGLVTVASPGGRTRSSNTYAVALFGGVDDSSGGVTVTPPDALSGVTLTPVGPQPDTSAGVSVAPEQEPINSIHGGDVANRSRLVLVTADDPPPATCHLHPDGTDRACGGCGVASTRRKQFEQMRRLEKLAVDRDERQRVAAGERDAIRSCSLCDDRGYRGTLPCRHDPHADVVNQRGIAKCRRALATRKDVS